MTDWMYYETRVGIVILELTGSGSKRRAERIPVGFQLNAEPEVRILLFRKFSFKLMEYLNFVEIGT